MDNENIRLEYEPYQDFRYVDTRTPFDTLDIPTASGAPVRIVYENNSQRGHRSSGLVYDEFCEFSLDEYECSFNGYHFELKKKAAPDFGEISPSQELNDFVNTLTLGE